MPSSAAAERRASFTTARVAADASWQAGVSSLAPSGQPVAVGVGVGVGVKVLEVGDTPFECPPMAHPEVKTRITIATKESARALGHLVIAETLAAGSSARLAPVWATSTMEADLDRRQDQY
jgi:hypothetical protein